MSDPTSTANAANRNLLFGILALQMDLITRDWLIDGLGAWAQEKSQSLGQILVERELLGIPARDFLETLVEKHLRLHGGDAGKSLAAVSALDSAREPLKKLAPDEGASTGAPRQTGSIPSYLNVLFSAGCAASGITARWWRSRPSRTRMPNDLIASARALSVSKAGSSIE